MRIGALAVVIVVLVVVAWAAISCGGRRDLVGYQRGTDAGGSND